ncbi:MAG: hypothetical protein RLZZ383_1870 [Pseudomonadota bacterium]|jgi:hypothetical protein
MPRVVWAILCAGPLVANAAPRRGEAPPDDVARALTLRTAGQVTTGVAVAALIVTAVVAETDGSELDRAYGRILGYTLATPTLVAGSVMWGIGDHRVRHLGLACVPSLTVPTGEQTTPTYGLRVVGVW